MLLPSDAAFLGRYEVLDVLGLGGMATVLRGWDPKLKRHVALKTVRLEALETEDAKSLGEALVAEAVAIAGISHPNIVSVYDVGDSPEAVFIAMELVDGVSLQTFLDARRALSPAQTVLIGMAVARALEAAHVRGIPHYDVKPANVLLGFDGTIKVADFGVSAIIATTAAPRDQVFGTAGYIAPETARGEERDVRGDLFGLGVLLYECATGRNPFLASTPRETIAATISTTPPPLASLLDGSILVSELSGIVESLMAKAPEERLPSASHAVLTLERLATRHRLSWRGETVQPADERPRSVSEHRLTDRVHGTA